MPCLGPCQRSVFHLVREGRWQVTWAAQEIRILRELLAELLYGFVHGHQSSVRC